ncbi:MAG: hypothetical protein NTW19_20425 [Planctomycetota bacterium]|nr:hypothetical protein [Planctomycetota bacterium]
MVVFAALLALQASFSLAAPPAKGGAKDEKLDEFLNEMEDSATPPDLEMLRVSHLSDLTTWQGVQGVARKKGKAKEAPLAEGAEVAFNWRVEGGAIVPMNDGPATTLVAVPEAGEYRIWLRYVAKPDRPQPVTLAISGPSEATHTYGAQGLSSQDGKTQEQKRPIRFEAEFQRMSSPVQPVAIWEYFDAKLQPGATTLALTSASKELHADRLLLTRSKSFRPSLITDPANATLNRTFYRFRLTEPAAGSARHGLSGGLTYHWGRPPGRGGTEPIWYYKFFDPKPANPDGKTTTVAVGEWTAFMDVTDGISSPGPWATASIGFPGVSTGQCEIQLAWFPHPGAVIRTLHSGVAGGGALLLIPIDSRGYTCASAGADDAKGAWGMRPESQLSLLETPEDVNRRHMSYVKAALADLPKQGNPAPKLIKLSTGNGAAASVHDAATEMLASLGLNSIEGAGLEMRKKLGLRPDATLYANDALFIAGSHDPTDPLIERNLRNNYEPMAAAMDAREPNGRGLVTTLKMGDEIGAIIGAHRINSLPDPRQAYHDYLRGQLRLAGRDPSFFGVEDVRELDFTPGLAPDAGRFERRLYYHSSRFNFVFTASFYKRMTDAVRKVFPNVRTYCNFSPHPPMFGQQMNGSDWFALTREGGATMGWAEDWAGLGGGWGFAGIQTVSYYAALVECAGRPKNLPAGFYVVTTMGGADRKVFCLMAHGIFEPQIYSFGPRYAGAEFSNFWDERADAYKEIAKGAFALGPADTIIAKGAREPRKVALLYNRSHEIWNGGAGGFQSDRLLTFIALQQAHQPVDIILEEDLTPEALKQYRVVYVQGYNLADRHVAALRGWVEAGGTLVGYAGTAIRDEYNDPSEAGAKLFGASARLAGCSSGGFHPQSIPDHKPIDHMKVQASPLTPAMEADVVGVKVVLTPSSGKPVATYADGSAAAVLGELGKGKTLLWGVTPGLIYKGDAKGGNRFRLDRLPMIAQAVSATVGSPFVEASDPQIETCFFEHESGLAVTLNEVAVGRDKPKGDAPADAAAVGATGGKPIDSVTLRVRTDRAIKEAVTSYAGPVPFKREGDRIVVTVPVPSPVDVLILR